MRVRQILDVHVVAYRGAVTRRIVRPMDREYRVRLDRDLLDARHQVLRHAARVFADEAGSVRADRVEVPQDRKRRAVGAARVLQDALAGKIEGQFNRLAVYPGAAADFAPGLLSLISRMSGQASG